MPPRQKHGDPAAKKQDALEMHASTVESSVGSVSSDKPVAGAPSDKQRNDLRAIPFAEQQLILPYIREWAQGGADVTGSRLMECYHSVQEIRRRTVAATGDLNLVLSPVAPDAASRRVRR